MSYSQFGLLPFAGTFAGDPEEVPNPNAEMAVQETTVAKPDIETDQSVIAQQIYDNMAARVPGWIAHDGNLEVWLIDDFSEVSAAIRQEAVTVPEAIFVTYGEEVLGIPIPFAQPSTALSNWTAVNDLGYTIPAGSQLTLRRTGDEQIVFEVTSTATIEPGTTVVSDVPIQAVDEGSRANGLSGPAEVVDPLAWVDTIDVPVPSANGKDGQSVEEYLNLLVMLMRVVALRPILPWDYAILSLRIQGIVRAVSMDGYRPNVDFGAAPADAARADLDAWLATYGAVPEFSEQAAMIRNVAATLDASSGSTWGHQREVTLVVTDVYGRPCLQETKDAVKQSHEALREVNFQVHVIDPEYFPVDVEYTVTAYAEQDPEIVRQLCDQALVNELSPANFRLGVTSPAIAAGEVIPPQATATPGRQTLHLNDYIALLDRQRGVDWVDSVTLNGVAADVVMTGPTTLPEPGTMTGTVNRQ